MESSADERSSGRRYRRERAKLMKFSDAMSRDLLPETGASVGRPAYRFDSTLDAAQPSPGAETVALAKLGDNAGR